MMTTGSYALDAVRHMKALQAFAGIDEVHRSYQEICGKYEDTVKPFAARVQRGKTGE